MTTLKKELYASKTGIDFVQTKLLFTTIYPRRSATKLNMHVLTPSEQKGFFEVFFFSKGKSAFCCLNCEQQHVTISYN